MSSISKIKLPNEQEARTVKDTEARIVFSMASGQTPAKQGQVPAPSDVAAADADKKFLRADGTWAIPTGGNDTTYAFAEGSTNGAFSVTPSDTGTAQSVPIHGLAAGAYAGTTTSATSGSSDLITSGGVYTELGNKQDTLSNTQLAAVNSGIDSTKVGQIATNQTNILSVEDMVCDTEFSTSTAYAVGDIVTYEHGLYKFTSAHSAGAWDSSEVEDITIVDVIGNIDSVLEAVL